ncbi:MAG TPA: hypothetical protein VGG02_12070 [Chthoniobacterales bacterium]|jgi:hypothetical protein
MISPDDESQLVGKKLRLFSFAAHAARGLVRDQAMRRKAMFAVMLGALLMLSCGSTFLAPALNPHERPGRFIFYWLVCGWLTFTVVLLALFDLLMVRAKGRAKRRTLARKLAESDDGA